MTFRLRHLLAAIVLHAVLLTLLVTGVQCSPQPVRPPVIQAVLLDPDRKEVAQRKKQEERRKQEDKRRQDEKRKAEEQQRKAEEQRRQVEAQRRQEQERQQREADEKRRLEAQKKKEAEAQKQAEELARRKQEEQERLEREEAVRREAQERARLEDALRRETMARELEREAAARAATEREARLSEWAAVLTRHVQRNWIRPAAPGREFECEVRVQLLPDGTVTYAKIVRSCGNSALDKSVEDAVFRASPLPRPADPSVFERDISITFVPELR